MTVPKHADLIHAFADGKALQYEEKSLKEWKDWANKFCPNTEHYDVRIKHGDRWQVVVRINGKLKWLGVFDSEEDAAAVAAPHFAGISA